MKIKLLNIAHGRSGDKGDAANVGIIAYDDKGYEIIKKHLTIERVKEHFKLGGGGTVSLKHDAQGKTLAAALLRMEIDI
jgi:hypothetical protein